MKRSFEKTNILRCFAAVSAALLLCLSVFTVPAFAERSGEVDGIKWSYVGGTLELVGKGEMPNFTENDPAPWQKFNGEIVAVNIDSRISAIGSLAFYDCKQLLALNLSKNVKSIGDMAFAGCEKLETVSMPAVTKIGKYAFSRCFSLTGAILPGTLTEIGSNVFYRCESLYTVTVPESVTVMGGSVFAYCKGLISATVNAQLETLPEWTFYGCERLGTLVLAPTVTNIGDSAFTRCDVLTYICHTGGADVTEQFKQNISSKVDNINDYSISAEPDAVPPATETDFEQQGDKVVATNTTVEATDSAVIKTDTAITHPALDGGYDEKKESAEIKISATITQKDGWDALLQRLDDEYINRGTLESETNTDVPITVDVMLLDGSYIYKKTLESIAAKRVTVNVATSDGSMWSIDGTQLSGCSFKSKYNLKYTVSVYASPTASHKRVLGGAASYRLETTDKIDFPITLRVYLDPTAKNHTATLYESVFGGGLERLKSMTVDENGVVSYKLTGVNNGNGYVIGIDIAGISAQDVELAENENEDWLENYVPVTEQYTITEVRGFMGMTMRQFTIAVILAIAVLAFVVFIIILALNLAAKKKAIDSVRNKKE